MDRAITMFDRLAADAMAATAFVSCAGFCDEQTPETVSGYLSVGVELPNFFGTCCFCVSFFVNVKNNELAATVDDCEFVPSTGTDNRGPFAWLLDEMKEAGPEKIDPEQLENHANFGGWICETVEKLRPDLLRFDMGRLFSALANNAD